jgi:HEAT repeat protein
VSRRLGALLAITLGTTLAGQARITNGQVDSHAAAQSLEREISAATSRGGARWVGYRIKVAGGRKSMDCLERKQIALEGATEVSVLARFEGAALTRLRTATPDCEIDAGGLPVTWLDGVKADDSAAWLTSLINGENADSRDRMNRVTKTAVVALGLHEGAGASRSLVSIARTHPASTVRNDALFWLSQRAGDSLAAGAIAEAIEKDPDTDVRKRAVFALSQLPRDESIPKLIDVARNNKNAAVRQQAMFWLGQTNDPRAIKFFEDVLLK